MVIIAEIIPKIMTIQSSKDLGGFVCACLLLIVCLSRLFSMLRRES